MFLFAGAKPKFEKSRRNHVRRVDLVINRGADDRTVLTVQYAKGSRKPSPEQNTCVEEHNRSFAITTSTTER